MIRLPPLTTRTVSLWLALTAMVAWLLADTDLASPNPWRELTAMGRGLLMPTVADWGQWLSAIGMTLAFALQAIALAALVGFVLALVWHRRWVRWLAALARSVHEVFWALLFIQVLGLSTGAGLLALFLPYAGTLAKIYGEQLQESDPRPVQALTLSTRAGLSYFLYCRLPLVWAGFGHYTRYRLECALRSSVVLGFIGLPTLGYFLETALREGDYASASALLYALIALVFSLKLWLNRWGFVLALSLSLWWFPPAVHWQPGLLAQFAQDLIPAPLRLDLNAEQAMAWLKALLTQALDGSWHTLVLAQVVVAATGLLALLAMPLNSPQMLPGWARWAGDGLLIVVRSLPEYLLNFIGLICLGPSMLPAMIAMSLHNGAIIAHLLGQHSGELPEAAMHSGATDRFFYHLLPRLYRQFLAYLLYRWEIIVRETAMLGVLGIPTLGFYIDSAFERLAFDVALLLILVSSLMTLGADSLSRWLRSHLALKTTPESE
ncbi:binding-protein-dependent transport system inner membrane protein [Simiduia agarivorans SA1 = DSM 21679]|uniref:Binding-protein-dependent transport system inner membrane protein n=1 Tax=Simiduia agarivorans (strain DSM 21679 / JCM 13881 / BCRC 17597 / SA1) TaxID=1117647 RepID=K4KJQ9_SIMAS|nr:binding-protein-dependent transport system inner membrane protein [Simiduia agarivorans SA1 = DSM 21679]